MRRWTKLAEMLGVNSIPVLGVFAGDWTSSTGLAVYWFENLIAAALVTARLALHRRWQPPPVRGAAPVRLAKAPSEMLVTAVPFTLAHGLFLIPAFVMVTKTPPEPDQLWQAAVALLTLQGLAFGIDLWTLAAWPAAKVNERADHLLGRVALVHISMIVGMFLFAWLETPAAYFGFFVGCKVLADLSSFLPKPDQGTPDRPPRWLAAIMRHVPLQNGETFEAYWVRTNRPPDPSATPPKATRPAELRASRPLTGRVREAIADRALSRRAGRRGRKR
jgi:hypothetical protein